MATITEGILQNDNMSLVFAVHLLIRENQKVENDESPMALCVKWLQSPKEVSKMARFPWF